MLGLLVAEHNATLGCTLAFVKRTIAIVVGWLIAAAVLYLLLVALEVYWNLYTWEPRANLVGAGLVIGALLVIASIWFLARATQDRISRCISLCICCALLVLAVYLLPAEPFTTGLFARDLASPLWYRAGRFLLLAAPAAFWVLALRTWRLHLEHKTTANSRSAV